MNESIISDYMALHYPDMAYLTYIGRLCDWVAMGNVNMYFTIRDNKIIDLHIAQDYIMTDNQILEFKMFCCRHGIIFNNVIEYNAAIRQYYLG